MEKGTTKPTFCWSRLWVWGDCWPQIVPKLARVVRVDIHSLNPKTSVNRAHTIASQPCALSHAREVGRAKAGRDMRNANTATAPFTITAEKKISY